MKTNAFRAALVLPFLAAAAPAAEIDASRIKEHVRVLSSDEFGGRGPTQMGETRTIEYLATQFAAAGLQPAGDNGSWYQEVPLVRYERVGPARVSLQVNGRSIPLAPDRQVTAASSIVGKTVLSDAPLVFMGYGMIAPEIGWNSLEGADLSGKVAVFLAGDPDLESARPEGFGGRALVYGGRFGAKAAAATKAGAAAVLVIHETVPPSFPGARLPVMKARPRTDCVRHNRCPCGRAS